MVSAQLTDWGEKSARQANELAEYFLANFAVDPARVYGAGYSAGGETMSRAVSMRPDLYAAYLHGGSQWDGTFAPIAENKISVYIFMAENDEYYGSQKARDAYNGLQAAYQESGLSDAEIDGLLQLEIPNNKYFNRLGIYNYHGGGSVVFDDAAVLNWILSAGKTGELGDLAFSDVPGDAWYTSAVSYVRESGLMNGTGSATFSPNSTVGRAMFAAILYRVAGSPAVSEPASFPDVPPDAYYAGAVSWAAENDIASGYTSGRFGSNDPISREQLAAILWRYAGSPEAEQRQNFVDESSIASYAADAANWARASGVINGKNGNLFDPQGPTTRAEVAVILRNDMNTPKNQQNNI